MWSIASQYILHSTWDCNRGFQEVQINQIRNIERDQSKLDSDLKDYFAIEEEKTKVKIKSLQYLAIGIALVFYFIKEVFLRAEPRF